MSRKRMARRPIAFSVQEMSPVTRQSRGHRSRVNVSLARDRGSERERRARLVLTGLSRTSPRHLVRKAG